MGQVDVPPNESHLPPLPINSTPRGVRTGDQFQRRGRHVGQHILDAARPRNGAGQFGHPHRQIVVSLVRP